MRHIKKLFILIIVAGIGYYENAAALTTMVEAGQNFLVPTQFITTFLEKVCGVVGIGFIFGALIQYKMHRATPTLVPLSRCVMLLLLGLALVAIPFIGHYAHVLNQV